ncbi:M56 family metallopeptidase [Belliella filtrata]|nr:M56 family metallopeptidase [Belliella filtrata]
MSSLLVIYHFALAKIDSFKFNRYYLLASLAFSLIIPTFQIPSFIPVSAQVNHQIDRIVDQISYNSKEGRQNEIIMAHVEGESNLEVSETTKTVISSKQFGKNSIHIIGYSLISLFFLVVLLFKMNKFKRLVNQNPNIKDYGFTYVLIEEKTSPFVFLHYLFVNAESYHSNQIENEILTHELTHIRQNHSIDILFVELLKVIFWFNPVLWFYKKAIQLNHEFLADKAVNNTYQNRESYQMLLLSKLTNSSNAYAMSSASTFGITKRRLQMMNESTKISKALSIKSLTIISSLFAFLVFSSSSQHLDTLSSLSGSSSVEAYEKLITEALGENTPFTLVLNKLDLENLRTTYNKLNDTEKEEVSEFPFLEAEVFEKLKELQHNEKGINLKFNFKNPPATKTINEEVWQYWKNSKNISLEIDDQPLAHKNLDSYDKTDFSFYEIEEVKPEGTSNDSEFLIKLTTHKHYEEKFFSSKKTLHTISSEYKNGDAIEVLYFTKNSTNQDQKVSSSGNNDKELLIKLFEGLLNHENKSYPDSKDFQIKKPHISSILRKNNEISMINIFKD